MAGSQGHPVFHSYGHRGVGNMHVTQLFQHLRLLHPSLYPIELHIDRKQGP